MRWFKIVIANVVILGGAALATGIGVLAGQQVGLLLGSDAGDVPEVFVGYTVLFLYVFLVILVLARRRRMSLLRELAAQADRRPNADPLAEQATRIAEQTERHYALVRTHATWSFVASVAAAIMGFTVLLVALLTSDVDVAPVAAAGGILSEFLAASLFWLHHQANRHLAKVAEDLRRSNARVLTAQTIAQVKDPGLRKNAQKRLIGALIEDGYLDPSWEPPAAAGAGNAPPEPPNKALKARRSA